RGRHGRRPGPIAPVAPNAMHVHRVPRSHRHIPRPLRRHAALPTPPRAGISAAFLPFQTARTLSHAATAWHTGVLAVRSCHPRIRHPCPRKFPSNQVLPTPPCPPSVPTPPTPLPAPTASRSTSTAPTSPSR